MKRLSGPMTSSEQLGELALELLRNHVSDINARAITRHALNAARQRSPEGEPTSDGVLVELSRSAAMFLACEQREQFLNKLRSLAKGEHSPRHASSHSIPICSEADLIMVREAVREVCAALELSGFQAQKVITAASELARNIAKYVGLGHIQLEVDLALKTLLVQAIDSGPGIANLEQILAGKYKSRTGMGRGLLGVRRLADECEITTGAQGTRVKLMFSCPQHLSQERNHEQRR